MSAPATERRVLILAPIGRDAALLARTLADDGAACAVCASYAQLSLELRRGAGALLVTEEVLAAHDAAFAQLRARQPKWSDLPVLVLTRTGANSVTADLAVSTMGNVTLLERPVRASTLSSAVRTALRARERQYQIRAHLEERERADRRKDEFIATLAHELRNPLAPIRTALDVMRLSGGQPPPGLLDTMERQLRHLVRLVDDLMDVSRVTRGKVRLERRPLDLREAIDAALEISRPQAQAAQQVVTVTLPPEPLIVDADAVRLAQVFSNLLNNAVKYTNAGGRINLAARAEAGRAVVTVSDTGQGISPEALPRLFEMFYQDTGDARPLMGLGVGLTLVRSIVELHGGRVTARSEGRGRGSEFTVTLPLADAQALAEREPALADAQALPEPAPAPAVETEPAACLPRVLVVDDNRDAAESLAALLEGLGAEVRVANDGRAALAVLDEFHPAAMFLDIGMPGMDGYEVADRVRARGDVDPPLLVALTGWDQDRDRRRTHAAGFQHHLVKPADAGRLRAVLESLRG